MPPVYAGTNLPKNQQVMINSIFYQAIPYFQDPEGCPLSF
jgi:hypothetical protein